MELSRNLWDEGHCLHSGRVLYESMKDAQRVKWAVDILTLCATWVGSIPEIEQLVEFANDPQQWKCCHQQFQQIRAITLEVEKSPQQHCEEFRALLDIAETVAKIIYNASHQPAPFDYHAGWHLPLRVKRIMTALQNPVFNEQALRLMFTVPIDSSGNLNDVFRDE